MVRQFVLMVTAALVAAAILIKTDMVGRLTYSVEKARLRALRDSLPVAELEPLARMDSGRTLAALVLPAVVSISTERSIAKADLGALDPHALLFPDRNEEAVGPEDDSAEIEEHEKPALDQMGPPAEPEERSESDESWILPSGQGSGFVFNAANGHILTNSHVVEDSDKIRVRLADGRRFDARVLGVDDKTDLAVIKIDADGLHEIRLGDSASGEVGDEVFAVGNPFGLDGTISRGIISAKNRSNVILEDIEYQGFLQTDAVINPGNSGGPLVNLRGEVIGINTAIATSTGFYEGIGFAIPSNRAARIVPHLVRGEKVMRGYLGVHMGAVAAVRESALSKLDWHEPRGVLVFGVLPDSPAAKAGLRPDDILVMYAGQRLASSADLTQCVADTHPGAVVEMQVWREKAFVALKIEIGRQPDNFSTRGWPGKTPRPRNE